MTFAHRLLVCFAGLFGVCALACVPAAMAQVSPGEVANPQLKALEAEYLQKLIAVNRQIAAAKFPFRFVLGRYVGVDPKDQAGSDTRGLEFVRFHERVLLKCSGNYNAAFNKKQLTRNQRTSQVFTDVAEPVLRLLPPYFADSKDFEGFGFEISYHVREASGSSDYEGKESLVVVFSFADALRFSQLATSEERQELLNASEIFVSGEPYGLALGKPDPLSAEELAKPTLADQRTQNSAASEGRTLTTVPHRTGLDFHAASGSKNSSAPASAPSHPPSMVDAPPLTPADVDELETKYQSALDDYGKFAGAVLHEATSTRPNLALFRNSLYLQITLRNPETFDKEKTSLYKRAALSFDTFLAPHLADLVSRLPDIKNLAGLNITILVQVSSRSASSEAVEFLCPLAALKSFAAFEISNQDLIEQSLVIVNGVRISLNLQQVE